MPLPFCTSHPEPRAPFADNRHNICRRVFLQGDLGTNPGSGEGERELTRSVTITVKPSLENPKKNRLVSKKISICQCNESCARRRAPSPITPSVLSKIAFVLLYFPISDYSVVNDLRFFFVFFPFFLRVKHLLYNGT